MRSFHAPDPAFSIFLESLYGVVFMNIEGARRVVWMVALAFVSVSVQASEISHADRELASLDGKKWIARTASLTDFDGGRVVVELRLFEDGKGGLVYRYGDQTEATKLYHQASCEETGAEVRRGDTVIQGEAVAAWSCMGAPGKQEDSEKSTGIMDAPRAAYYVHALAPSGSAPLGVNFHSVGIARYQSSIAGESNANVSIDNGRCTASAVDHHTGPFVGNYELKVVCIGVQRGLLNTSMSACIPRVCSTDVGAVEVI